MRFCVDSNVLKEGRDRAREGKEYQAQTEHDAAPDGASRTAGEHVRAGAEDLRGLLGRRRDGPLGTMFH